MSRTSAVTGVLVLSVVASGAAGPLLVTPLTPLSPEQQARLLIESLFTGGSAGALGASEGVAESAGLFSNGGDVLAFDTGVLLTDASADAAIPRLATVGTAATTTPAALAPVPSSSFLDLAGDPLALALITPIAPTTPFDYIVGRRGGSAAEDAVDKAFADFLGSLWWPAVRQDALAEADTADEDEREEAEPARASTSQEPVATVAVSKALTMLPGSATASISASRAPVAPMSSESRSGLDSVASPSAFLPALVPGTETAVDGTSRDLDRVFVTESTSDASLVAPGTGDRRDNGQTIEHVTGDNGRLVEFLPNDAAPIVWIDPLAATAHDFVTRSESPELVTVIAPGSSLIDNVDNPIAAGMEIWPALPGGGGSDAPSTDRFDTVSMLDPDDTLAFIDGVTSTGAARADSSLPSTTVVASVPEPSVAALLVPGLALYGAFVAMSRRRRVRAALR
jgi:hypothetical protein